MSIRNEGMKKNQTLEDKKVVEIKNKIQELSRVELELHRELATIQLKKERFRGWTRSLGESEQVQEMFVDFDGQLETLIAKLDRLKKLRKQLINESSGQKTDSESNDKAPEGELPAAISTVRKISTDNPPETILREAQSDSDELKSIPAVTDSEIYIEDEPEIQTSEHDSTDDRRHIHEEQIDDDSENTEESKHISSEAFEKLKVNLVEKSKPEPEKYLEYDSEAGQEERISEATTSFTSQTEVDDGSLSESNAGKNAPEFAQMPVNTQDEEETPISEKYASERKRIVEKILSNRAEERSGTETEEEEESDKDVAASLDKKHARKFSVKRLRSRFSLRKSKKSKEEHLIMESGRGTTQPLKENDAQKKAVEPVEEEVVQKDRMEDKSVLYLGIDLGTSETTVAASNDIVETVLSVMGMPKDFISQKLLKKDKLFGIDALRNKLAIRMYRPLEKGVIKDTDADLEAAREIVKHVISLANPEEYDKVYAVIGAPARSSFANQQALVDAAREIVDAVMIVSEPFAVAYGEGKIYNSLVIDIGAGTTDICCLKGSMPEEEDQFTLLKAGDHIDVVLMESIKSKIEGAQITKDLAKMLKEEYSYVQDPLKPAVVPITIEGKPTKVDITKDIKAACESIVPEIVTCVKKIIANFNPEFQEELKQNIILAGGGSLIKNLAKLLERQLNSLGEVKVTCVEAPIEAGAKGALALAKDLTDEYWRAL